MPRDEVARRLEALRAAMRRDGMALAWIEHLTDRLYFSGSFQDGVLLVPADGPAAFLVRKSLRRAEVEAGVDVRPYPGRASLAGQVAARAGAEGRIGLCLDVTPATTYLRVLDGRDATRVVDLSSAVRTIRAVKSPWEIEQIERASEQVTTLYREIPAQIRPGITELELSGKVEGRLRALGHAGTVRVRRPGADITIGVVVSGASGLYPTSFNGPVGAEGPYPNTASGGGWKQLATGETVMLDLVTFHNGYHADTTRTFFLGARAPAAAREAHERCCQILRRIEASLRPGRICAEIYREISAWLESNGRPPGFMGYAENEVRFLGHGVGLELDELPVLAEKFDTPLRPGMVLAVEPKAFLEGIGPVGVENTYVVEESGCRSLCEVDESLIELPR